MALEKSSPEFADALGLAISAISYHLCGVKYGEKPKPGDVINGYDKLQPIYVQTTEGRDGPGPHERENYSSCADQLHRILELVGVRGPQINRGKNHVYGAAQMSKLQPPTAPYAAIPPASPVYRPPIGSLCLIWTTGFDAHALVVLGPGSDDNHILTGNYGAGGMSAAIAPGTSIADSPCVWDEKKKALLIGGSHRALHTVITPKAIVPYIDAQIDLTGVSGGGVIDISEIADALGARI